MEDAKGQVVGSAAEIYEQFFVPALFAEWAERVADAAEIRSGDRVIDVACGTGVLAREAARRAGADRVSGLDRNAGMLAVARAAAPDIDWREGRAEELPFADHSVDVVVSQFGLMFFDDRERALAEMRRVLRPGGRLVVAVWGPLADTPGYAAMANLLARLFGDEIANELRAPYCLGDPGDARALFARAGIPEIRLTTQVGRARFPSLDAWVHTDIRGWTLADRIDDDQYELLLREARSALARFTTADGAVAFDAPAHLIRGHAPVS